MQSESRNEPRTDEVRRSIHEVATALIYVRELAETLAEHIPLLVSISRAKCPQIGEQVPEKVLDALPSIPSEIVTLCKNARASLQELGAEGVENDGGDGLSVQPNLPPSFRPDSPHDQIQIQGRRVLIVEDEDNVRYVLSQNLESLGCHVIDACDGEEALRLIDEEDFDLILMDLRIPGLSGWETAKRIREKERKQGDEKVRIVGLTASFLWEDQQEAMTAGMDEVLVKPIDEMALQSLLSRFT